MSEQETTAQIATELRTVGFDSTGYYALFFFDTMGGPLTIAYPPDLLDVLAEAALYLDSHCPDDLARVRDTMRVWRVREVEAFSTEDAGVALRLGIGRQAEIRLGLSEEAARALASALLEHLPPAPGGRPRGKGS